MQTRMVEIPTPDGTADAFVAVPDEGGARPGVLLYTDIFGIRPVIRAMAERLAEHGYYVLVPNVFYRRGAAPVLEVPDLTSAEERAAFFGRIMLLLQEHTPARAALDADAYLSFLAAQPEVATGRVGVVGYCMGAGLALRTAAEHRDVAGVACFHPGRLVTDEPDSPHRLAPNLTAEIHFGLAERDEAMPPEAVAALNKALDEAGVRYTSEVYPDTDHGFTMSDTAVYSPSGDETHWDRMLQLFARTLADG
ncbi:dienelactone hydrolase family protein [Streptomyces sp. NRRL B-1677]|uniref:dienelactone hydrolase family protein n=1 Tax=Streptomyces sp. NRRL B-1677 TaxID=2682966 RepID=UPI001892B797|nr:dienelactone hydrolase family protein [Streptomyces sp. NRRL B-1677]MBF6047358.1 dienelactone hydrolase family protein [Streptomyces sp. NRRL B-1677]